MCPVQYDSGNCNLNCKAQVAASIDKREGTSSYRIFWEWNIVMVTNLHDFKRGLDKFMKDKGSHACCVIPPIPEYLLGSLAGKVLLSMCPARGFSMVIWLAALRTGCWREWAFLLVQQGTSYNLNLH